MAGASILAVEDDEQIQLVIRRILEREGHAMTVASTAREALKLVQRQPFDLVTLDVELPDQDGLSVLSAISAMDEAPAVIMISGKASVEVAAKAVQLGAADFVQKPFTPDRLAVTVTNVLRFERLRRAHSELEQEERGSSELRGTSAAMVQLRRLIDRAAPTEGRVLITGENGTGKELVALELHQHSRRSAGPLVKLNCAAVPSELIESELFGHEQGAFTGATAARRGKFEAANGGTLFLDEVGEMPLAMQAKLLRVLQEGELERVGGNKPVRVDVRIVAATNRDLEKMVEEGELREDLFYRLNVIHLHVPPLRERREDIPELARVFAERAARKNGRPAVTLSDEALAALSEMPFPGNIRELQNTIERIVIFADAPVIGGAAVRAHGAGSPRGEPTVQLYRKGATFQELVQAAQAQIIGQALREHGGNMADTARALGLERSHLYKKCKALGVTAED